jgi:riboflavin synthase
MFTGIIEELGTIEAFTKHDSGARFSVQCSLVLSDLTVGASIAVNGVCLTAVEVRSDGFSAELSPETLSLTNLEDLHDGDPVNLERPLSLQTRLSGHIVQGHVDGTGAIESLKALGDGNWELLVRIPRGLERYLVYKGSITIDGISLTIAALSEGIVRVAVIPHTFAVTNLGSRSSGDRVNIECDVLAKHVARLLDELSLPRSL